MSLEVLNLVKVYGAQRAVDDISFSVKEGEIVGFLGPNGAGKSTTMKIATGYLSATSGTVKVSGLDVNDQPTDTKRIIGYLPEHNPLYLDMYVHEYLGFVGKIFGLNGKILKDRVNEMISLCGLTLEQNKLIGSLSKGYRQRVGLAQSLIHNPQVLILDEPTSGLDPNQILEIRKLIKEVSKDKTVVFSTHIMQEVQALCDRVVVINRGKIVANDQLKNLTGSSVGWIEVEFKESVSADELKNLAGVVRVEGTESRFKIYSQDGIDVRPELMKFTSEKNLTLLGLRQQESSLEEIFRSLTEGVAA
jgi:ABC-2 type transport system ATP-binding protein